MVSLPKVFLCYARKDNVSDDPDRRWLDRLRTFLKPHDGEEFEVFHDQQVPAGGEWDPVILQQVNECHVAVLLVSQHFLGSKYIRDKELPLLLERRRAGKVLILPLLLSDCTDNKKSYRYPDPKHGPEIMRISDLQYVGGQKEALEALTHAQQTRLLKLATDEILAHVESLHPAAPSTIPTPTNQPKNTPRHESITVVTVPSSQALVPSPDHPWINSLGMRFIAVPGTKVWFSVWPTRVRDYEAFAKGRGAIEGSWRNPEREGIPVTPGPDHPVGSVNWYDTQEFCRWLTKKEQREQRLKPGQRYRLPTDREWSTAVGLPHEPGKTPKDRDGKIPGVYPWGTQWPPPSGAGNFADTTFQKQFGKGLNFIDGYDDGFATTSPVGSFNPSSTSLHDLSGNVWEWCEDLYDASGTHRVLRGGSCTDGDPQYLLSSFRIASEPGTRYELFGFRVVLGVDEPAR